MEMKKRLSADELEALRCVSGEDPVSAANLCRGLRIGDRLQRTRKQIRHQSGCLDDGDGAELL